MSEWRERAREMSARQIERRKFLKGAAALSTLAMLETGSIAKAILKKSYGPPQAQAIDTIVVTMMENRSLDHYLGWMGGAINGQQAHTFPTRLVLPNGNPVSSGACATGQSSSSPAIYAGDGPDVSTYHLDTHCLASDPNHGWEGSRTEFNGGAMNGFHHVSGRDSLGYYDKADVPFLGWLAENYTTFANYYSSVMGPTYPNRIYWLAGQGGGFKGNTIPTPNGADPEPDGHDWACVFHQLDQAGIPWTYYHGDLATVMLFFNRVEENPGKVRFIADYFADAAAGTLTPIVFLDPSFVVWGNDDHPARDVMWGQRYLYDTFLALAQSRHWYNPRTGKGSVYVVTYDEGGGFYDHVAPPRVVNDPNASSNHCEDWGRLGFRVPTVVASPWTREPYSGGPTGRVRQDYFDHTSILRFVQWRFGLGSLNDFAYGGGLLPFANGANLGARDKAPLLDNGQSLQSLETVLNFATVEPDLPPDMPEIPLHALQGLACAQSQVPEENGGANPLEDAPDATLPPLARPRLQPPGPTVNSKGERVVAHEDWIGLADRGYFGRFDFRERAKHGVFRD